MDLLGKIKTHPGSESYTTEYEDKNDILTSF